VQTHVPSASDRHSTQQFRAPPTETEPPFLIAQVAAFVFFVAVGIASVRRFHPPASA
jgi:hypothetical protein